MLELQSKKGSEKIGLKIEIHLSIGKYYSVRTALATLFPPINFMLNFFHLFYFTVVMLNGRIGFILSVRNHLEHFVT